jgi:hypothetical protein
MSDMDVRAPDQAWREWLLDGWTAGPDYYAALEQAFKDGYSIGHARAQFDAQAPT